MSCEQQRRFRLGPSPLPLFPFVAWLHHYLSEVHYKVTKLFRFGLKITAMSALLYQSVHALNIRLLSSRRPPEKRFPIPIVGYWFVSGCECSCNPRFTPNFPHSKSSFIGFAPTQNCENWSDSEKIKSAQIFSIFINFTYHQIRRTQQGGSEKFQYLLHLLMKMFGGLVADCVASIIGLHPTSQLRISAASCI